MRRGEKFLVSDFLVSEGSMLGLAGKFSCVEV